MEILKRWNIEEVSAPINVSAEYLEKNFIHKHEWMLAAWEYNYEDIRFTNDLGPR